MCYKRAESNDDREGIAFTELARLYREAGGAAQAASYYEQMLSQRDAHQDAGGKEARTTTILLDY